MPRDDSFQKKMRIVVTGGAGFIGSSLVDFLIKNNHEVIIIDDFSTGKFENIKANIDHLTLIEQKVENLNFETMTGVDALIHLAAQASVPLSIENFKDSSKTNLLSSINVIDFCSSKKIPLVYASSSAVYGSLPLGDDENNEIDLLTPYAADKFSMELYAEVAFKLHGLSSIGLRFFNVYGPRQDPKSPYSGVISIFVDRIIAEKEITINGGYQTRDFIFVNDVIDCIYKSLLLATTEKVSETINVLTGVSTSIDNLVDIISKQTGCIVKKKYKSLEKGDVEKSAGNAEKMFRLLKIKENTFTDIGKGLGITIDFLKSEND